MGFLDNLQWQLSLRQKERAQTVKSYDLTKSIGSSSASELSRKIGQIDREIADIKRRMNNYK